MKESESGMLADALVGAAVGAAAVWVMDRVDWFNFRREDPKARERTKAVRPKGAAPAHVAADKAVEAFGGSNRFQNASALGEAVHYSLGVMPGALYGALRPTVPGLTTGRGSLFGLGLFLIQDEGLNAVSGLSAKPKEYPWQAHARGLIAHLVYGLALDSGLRLLDGLRAGRGGRA